MDINGKYTSQDGNFVLTITNSNEDNSTFTGTYVSKYTPQGELAMPVTGRWFCVNNPGGALTPLALNWSAFARPDDSKPYCIADAWVGTLTQTGRFTASGVRNYLPAGGQYVLSSLGTNSFSTT